LFLFGEGGAGKEIGLFLWVALGLMVLAIAWLLLFHMAPADVAPVAPAETVAAPPAAPAVEAAVPEGAGIITETRDAKPVIKVYFATGKAEVAPAFGPEAAAFKTYLDAHQGSVIGVSGYNDPTGNAAVNAALSKKRAQAVKAALVAAQIPDASIELIKPEAATDATVTAAEARRVEVFVK
jgi:outer membrane protein OmpA-like peptidoglycan-associated protein